MPNIINPNCISLPQQVEKNKQDILKILASNLEELTGLQFIPSNLIYQDQKAVISGKFIVIRDETSTEIDGVVSIPIVGENGIIVDGSEDNTKIRISLDQSDRDLFNYVQKLVNRTTESDEIVFTSDMQNFVEDFVSEATQNFYNIELLYDKFSDDININRGYTAGILGGTYTAFEFNPKNAKGIFICCKAGNNNAEADFYIDFSRLKNGEVSYVTSARSTKQSNTSGNNSYIVKGVTIEVHSVTENELYVLRVTDMWGYNVTSDSYSQYNDDSNYFVHKIYLVGGEA